MKARPGLANLRLGKYAFLKLIRFEFYIYRYLTSGTSLQTRLKRGILSHVNTVGPLLSGHPGDFENWPLDRGWLLNRGVEYSTLLTK